MKVNEYISGSKVNGFTGEAQASQKDKVRNQTETPPGEEKGDKVQLSGRSKEIARIQDKVANAPDVRMDKVADIKARVEAGTYEVNPQKVANAMIRGLIDETI